MPSGIGVFITTLLFTLLVSIVGPIFLVVWFVMNQQGAADDVPWMLWIGVGITSAALILGTIFGLVRAKRVRKRGRLRAVGVRGTAEIIWVDETNVFVNGGQMIKLTLNVSGAGITPFSVIEKLVVTPLHYAGLAARVLPVLVDPSTGEIEILWRESGAGATAAYPPFSGGRI